jgi:hypothetical protein
MLGGIAVLGRCGRYLASVFNIFLKVEADQDGTKAALPIAKVTCT